MLFLFFICVNLLICIYLFVYLLYAHFFSYCCFYLFFIFLAARAFDVDNVDIAVFPAHSNKINTAVEEYMGLLDSVLKVSKELVLLF